MICSLYHYFFQTEISSKLITLSLCFSLFFSSQSYLSVSVYLSLFLSLLSLSLSLSLSLDFLTVIQHIRLYFLVLVCLSFHFKEFEVIQYFTSVQNIRFCLILVMYISQTLDSCLGIKCLVTSIGQQKLIMDLKPNFWRRPEINVFTGMGIIKFYFAFFSLFRNVLISIKKQKKLVSVFFIDATSQTGKSWNTEIVSINFLVWFIIVDLNIPLIKYTESEFWCFKEIL